MNPDTPPCDDEGLTLKMWIETMQDCIDTASTSLERDLAEFCQQLLIASPDSPTIQHLLDSRALSVMERSSE